MLPAKPPPEPYRFQVRALAAVHRKLIDEDLASIVLVSPTGSGKTVMAAWAMQHDSFRSVRCISHRVSINDQNRELLCPTFTPQALAHGIPEGFGKPDLVIWEECHHSEAPTYKAVRRRFPKAKMLGLTATPQRADGLALDLFDDMVVAAHYSELLINGTIAPCEVRIPSEFYEGKAPDLVKAYLDNREHDTRALFFCRTQEEANAICKRLKRVQPFHCGMPRNHNRLALEAFKKGNLDALTTVDALGEGIDVPEANMALLDTPCKNVSTYLQRCGRVLRSFKRKKRAIIIDCVGASTRHGSPTEDRIYSIDGTGIQRRGRSGINWEYEREVTRPGPPERYQAKWRTSYGWNNPTEDDKRRQLGWLRQLAAKEGYDESIAERAFHALFGHGPGQDPEPAE